MWNRWVDRLVSVGIALALVKTPACAQKDTRDNDQADRSPSKTTYTDRGLPRTTERQDDREAMVRSQIKSRGIDDPAVLAAMRAVPRHWFVPDDVKSYAYYDRPLPIGQDQTISQPYIVAFMTEALNPTPESKVLEVGTGSGYQAAVLAEITPHVYTIEIVEPLAKRAIATFKKRGYNDIEAKIGDGYAGWPEHAPFDAIIVTCAPGHVPPKLFEQLKPGGRLCIPVGGQFRTQWLELVIKDENGNKHVEKLMPVRFVPMTGDAERREHDGEKP
jgi:protein-L-isoaspartate(D-aspartate) O-methyltransferase